MSIARSLVAHLEHEAKATRKMLEIVPDAKLDWKPHEKSMTLGALASHLAETPLWVSSMLEDEMDFANLGDYRPFEGRSAREIVAALDRNLKGALDLVRDRDDAFLAREWTARMGDQVVMQAAKGEAIREIALHHTIHHRGQLSVYLRLLGVPLPKVYGPTADDPGLG
jgi:uncharacterized damage-inducible protein DinB